MPLPELRGPYTHHLYTEAGAHELLENVAVSFGFNRFFPIQLTIVALLMIVLVMFQSIVFPLTDLQTERGLTSIRLMAVIHPLQ